MDHFWLMCDASSACHLKKVPNLLLVLNSLTQNRNIFILLFFTLVYKTRLFPSSELYLTYLPTFTCIFIFFKISTQREIHEKNRKDQKKTKMAYSFHFARTKTTRGCLRNWLDEINKVVGDWLRVWTTRTLIRLNRLSYLLSKTISGVYYMRVSI